MGIARGSIEIDTSKLQRDRQIVQRVTRDMGRDVERSFGRSTSVVNTFNQRIDSSVARLQTVRGELTAIATVGAGTTFFGLRAADNLQNLQIRFRELAGDQERGLALMEQIGEAAADLNLPVRETQDAFAGLVPAIRDAGGEIDVYINRIARLSTLNRQEGISGAVFAVREALASGGTDLVSLAERFNLPRRRLRELIEETGDFAEALDIILNEQGATNQALEDFSDNLQTATTRLRDAATRGLERAFSSQLDGAVDLTNQLADGIDRLPDGVLQFGANATIAATGVAGLTLALTQALETYQNLEKAGVFAPGGVGRGAAALGIAGFGLANAPRIATAASQQIGRATGNDRLANQTIEQTNSLIRQAVASLAILIAEGGRQLTQAISRGLITPILTIPQQINTFRGHMEVATGELIVMIGNVTQRLGQLLPGSGLNDRGQSLIDNGQAQIEAGRARLDTAQANGEFIAQTIFDEINGRFDTLIDNAIAFGAEAADAVDGIADTVDQEFGDTADVIRDRTQQTEEDLEALAQALRENLDNISDAIQFRTQLNQLEREGSSEQIESRISSLQDEAEAIRAFLPELEALAPANEEAAESLRSYRLRLDEITGQINDLGNLAPNVGQRELQALSDDFFADVQQLEQDRQQALTDLASNVRDDLAELDQDLASEFTEARQEEIEAVQEYQKERAEVVEDFQKRLLQIERTGREEIAGAAGRLDAAGVKAAIRAREKATEEAQERFSEENERNNERLQETRQQLAQERQEILNNYAQRRADIIAQGNQERALIQRRFQDALNARQQEYNAARQGVNARVQALQAELNAQQQGYQAMVRAAQNFGRSLANAASRLSRLARPQLPSGPRVGALNTRGTPVLPALPTNRVPVSNSGVSSSSGNRGVSLASFNTGGVASGIRNDEGLAYIGAKERVLTPQQTSAFDKLVNMLGGLMTGGSSAPNVNQISIDLTGVDSLEGAIEATVRQTLGKVYRQQIAGATG